MQLLSVLILIITFAAPAGDRKYSCALAGEYDRAHGANEAIEVWVKPMRTIQGRITFSNGKPVEEAVIEVYEYGKSDKNFEAYEIAKSRERKFACFSNNDGHFCLSDLPSGWYALRIGTRESSGWNEMLVKVRVDRAWWKPWLKPRQLEIALNPGT